MSNKPRDTDLANYADKFLNIDKGQQLFFGFIFIGLLIKKLINLILKNILIMVLIISMIYL